MALTEDGRAANLEELRSMLAGRTAWVLVAAGGLGALQTLPRIHFSGLAFLAFSLLLVLGLVSRYLNKQAPRPARGLLIGGSTLLLLTSLALFPASWLPLLALPIIFLAAMLAAGAEIAAALAVIAGVAWLTYGARRSYDLVDVAAALVLGIVLARLVAHTFHEALQWAWSMQERADELLAQTRAHRAELARALKASDLAYALQSRTQQELIYARKQAEEARRTKERFAANISHELRTPLNLIMGFSELMALSPEVYGSMTWPASMRHDVQQIHRSSSHLLAMIDDILDLSRFEIVGFSLHKEPTSLEALVRDTVDITRELFRDRPVRLELAVEPGLPALDVDRTRIRQVLLNLLNNAHRFTERGCVAVAARRLNGEVIVSVRDTGPGIPADKLGFIFDEFYQVDVSLRRSHGGSGLGLAICKRFVEVHGGRIWVESQEGAGATFSFALPIPGESAPAVYLRDQDYRRDPLQPAAYTSIMVVDPDPAVAALVRRHMPDYEVVQVTDEGRLAGEIHARHPRAVIYNVQPGQSSQVAVETLPPVPLIECSLPSPAWLARDLAVVACLTKPVNQAQLLEQLRQIGEATRVLIVDDDRGFVHLVRRMLEASGQAYQVRHAYNGVRGLAALREQTPDVVLLDLMMPEMDGFQLLDAMRREPALKAVPVILLTATTYAEDLIAEHASPLVVRRSQVLHPPEVLQCLKAIIEVLEPQYEVEG